MPPVKVSAVILAAGEGTRFNSRRSKVLHEIAGKPMIGYVLDTVRALAPISIHVVVGSDAEAVRLAVDDGTIHWHEQRERLGTAHALLCATDALGGSDRVLVLCADVPFIKPAALRSLLDTLDTADFSVLTADLPDPAGYGRIVRGEDGHLARIVEERDATPGQAAITEVNTGIIAARGDCLPGLLEGVGNDNAQGEYYLTDCVEHAVAGDLKVAALTVDDADQVRGINTLSELERAERQAQLARAGQLMARGVTLRDAARLDVRGEVHVGRDVVIDVNVVLEGRVELGDDVHIGAGAYCATYRSETAPGSSRSPSSRPRAPGRGARSGRSRASVPKSRSPTGSGSATLSSSRKAASATTARSIT